ncbi:DUF6319 family protein [Nocardia sp. CDC159]|uniref:DUF6319 family protein n=1 Tax=Nocardia pulmonis TaxID=2951408 RepID=A0A9X2J1Z1_9NOCA|nr:MULTISPECIES: DUF6319 family protein [Nocardia]MCM6778600.1 DUF6319 family protein [Nocardia pulmonis]MCM6791489.1 DUF6319 family protein [Nocardia sp. CDC159]
MSSRRTKPQPLSDTEIRQIATDIAGGRPPMVWFTAAAVGVPEGRSGKVVALGDPAEGDFLQVRPTGSKDVLSFSPTEVTLTKPARRTPSATGQSAKQTKATRKDTAVTMPSTVPPSVAPSPTPPSPAPAESASAEPKPAASPAADKPAAKSAPAAKPKEKAGPAARKAKTPEVTVTLSGTADGEWTVDVVNGKKRTVRGLAVSGSAVAQAAKLLHPEVAEVVDSVLESVRSTQRAKVEQLQAELEQARKMLDELSG